MSPCGAHCAPEEHSQLAPVVLAGRCHLDLGLAGHVVDVHVHRADACCLPKSVLYLNKLIGGVVGNIVVRFKS